MRLLVAAFLMIVLCGCTAKQQQWEGLSIGFESVNDIYEGDRIKVLVQASNLDINEVTVHLGGQSKGVLCDGNCSILTDFYASAGNHELYGHAVKGDGSTIQTQKLTVVVLEGYRMRLGE